MNLDPVIHSPTRLQIMSALAAAQEAEFTYIRDTLKISAPQLSKQAAALEAAGYIEIRKGHVGKWPRTWFKLSETGREAFAGYVEALRQIVGQPSGGDGAGPES